MTVTMEQIETAVASIRELVSAEPTFAIVLGTGLGALAREIEDKTVIPFSEIRGFVATSVEGHQGDLIFGKIGGRPVVAMEGRLHFYEGWSMTQITLPVRVMRALGATFLVVSSASGGMNPLHRAGDLILIDDHINLMGDNPLIGPNDERLGPRFPDMSRPYDPELLDLAESIALAEGIRAHRGVYVAVSGPNLETRAEYRFLRAIGADVVGMSTVPEVLAAVHGGMRVLGVTCVTDRCLPDALEPVDIEEIIRVASETEPKLTRLIRRVVVEAG